MEPFDDIEVLALCCRMGRTTPGTDSLFERFHSRSKFGSVFDGSAGLSDEKKRKKASMNEEDCGLELDI